jgi:hypothetical protein
MKELHVFPQPESLTIPAISICASEWLADQVLEGIRNGMTCVEDELETRKSLRWPHFLLKFISQKFA